MLFNVQMLIDLIHTVAENPMAGGFVVICALTGLYTVCQTIIASIEAMRKK